MCNTAVICLTGDQLVTGGSRLLGLRLEWLPTLVMAPTAPNGRLDCALGAAPVLWTLDDNELRFDTPQDSTFNADELKVRVRAVGETYENTSERDL